MEVTQSLPVLKTNALSLPGHNISVKEMYSIAMRNNTVWGIDGYKVPAEYLDSRKLQEISSGKFTKKAPRALKLPDYLTETLRYAKTPGPNAYNIVKPWVDETKNKTQPKPTKKNSYIDLIIHENKTRPKPGPGAYNIRETDEQIKKKQSTKREAKGSERTNFLCEMEYLSEAVPGPGNYNPREITAKVKENKMKPEDWKKKHNEQKKQHSKSAFPDVGTFHPEPVAYRTFGKLFDLHKEKKDLSKVKMFGTATRFAAKKDPKKDPNNFPGPGMYPMTATWNGKLPPGIKDTKDRNWMNKITKGVEMSIYYS